MLISLFRSILLTPLFFLLSENAFSQSPSANTPVPSEEYAGDLWAAFNNPATASRIRSLSAGVFHEQVFFLKELAHSGITCVMPFHNKGNLFIGYSQFGYRLYKEQHGSAGYARSFGNLVHAGIRFDYLSVQFGEVYGKTSKISGSVGIIIKLTSEINISAAIFQPERALVAQTNDDMFQPVITSQLSYNFSPVTFLYLESIKHGNTDAVFNTGFEHIINNRVRLTAGVTGFSTNFFFGAGFRSGSFWLDFSSGYDFLLVYSPQFAIRWKKPK
jgi:hypothetical protein